MSEGCNDRMDRRNFILTMAAAAGAGTAAVGSVAGCELASKRPASRPNIVLIVADDLGYGDLSGYGRPDYQTPNLDRLAAQGTRFTQAYAISSVCTPTRVGLMTGRYPARLPVGLREPLTLSDEDREIGLPADVPTVSSLLKQAGYSTALFGKWHLGVRPEFHPNRHGFDEFFGPLTGAVDYVSHRDPRGRPDLYRNNEQVQIEGYLTDLMADEAVRFIRRRPEPFFLSQQGTAPHPPWQRRGDAPFGRAQDRFNVGSFDRFPDMVRALDDAVGRILEALDETGLTERTLVIFSSDNGGGEPSNMGGLATHFSLWEGDIRVPAFVRWPGVVPAGVTTIQVASTLDWTATILAAAGTAPPASSSLDGIDLLPVLTGLTPPQERTIVWRVAAVQGAVRQGTWKYLREDTGEHLFDLALDPGERLERKGDQQQRFDTLKTIYAAWEKDMLPPIRQP